MAVYRNDQVLFTFGVEAAQGGDPEQIEGTLASGPSAATLDGAHTAGSRIITLAAEFTAMHSVETTATGVAVLTYGDTTDDASDVTLSLDDGSATSPGVQAGMTLKIGSEYLFVNSVGGTNSRDLNVTRGYEGTTAASNFGDKVAVSSRFTVGDFIRIGTIDGTPANTPVPIEVRRVEVVSGTTITLDRPLAFGHAHGQTVKPINAIGGDATRNDKHKYITWIPGVYESVDTPDPAMNMEGRRFLGTQSKRNWSVVYPGQQTLSGSISGIVLLNGWPLRFPIGKVTTIPQAVTGSATLNGAVSKGDIYITLSTSHGVSAGEYITIYDAANLTNTTKTTEVRRVDKFASTNVAKLNYPLSFDHITGAFVREDNSPAYYDHEIVETVDLDTLTWNVSMLDSAETTANVFDRRYVGGMVDSSTLSAEEGGLVTYSWDGVQFLNMMHNQQKQDTGGDGGGAGVETNLYKGGSITAGMPRYALTQPIDTDDIVMVKQTNNSANTGSGYPITDPYYFSEGTIKFFGTEFARVRSFSLSISNSIEPRYYIGRQGARARGPFETMPGQREYSMSASVALPDTIAATANTTTGATELFKQLLLEGDYGVSGSRRTGLTMSLRFDRGTNDYMIIDVPGSTTAGSPTAGASGVNKQGLFITTAPHSIGTDNPFQVDLEIMFRSLSIWIRDAEPLYP